MIIDYHIYGYYFPEEWYMLIQPIIFAIGLIMGAAISNYQKKEAIPNEKLSKFYHKAFIENQEGVLDMEYFYKNWKWILLKWTTVLILLALIWFETGPLTVLLLFFMIFFFDIILLHIVRSLNNLKREINEKV